MHRIIKSIFWLVGCGGVGFALFTASQPSEKTLEDIRRASKDPNFYTRDHRATHQKLMDKLKEATQK